MASVSAELSAWVARLMEERPLRDERGSFSLGLSRLAEGGRPRHGATRKAVDTSPLSPYLVPASGAYP
jgi:hypothetical protein